MAGKRKEKPDPIPESFATLEEAGEFWDGHDLGDYWDQTEPRDDFSFRIKRREYLVSVVPSIARRLRIAARERGLSSEALANLWLKERLQSLRKSS
jgi:CopG antitoxin of type II toxin-antitoxin system